MESPALQNPTDDGAFHESCTIVLDVIISVDSYPQSHMLPLLSDVALHSKKMLTQQWLMHIRFQKYQPAFREMQKFAGSPRLFYCMVCDQRITRSIFLLTLTSHSSLHFQCCASACLLFALYFILPEKKKLYPTKILVSDILWHPIFAKWM